MHTNFISSSIDIPNSMSEMEGRHIYCSGRDLHTVSADVFSYPDISYLELSPTREASLDFKLGELPRAIGRLTELRFLILDTNNLRSLPDEIRQLRQLSVLVISNNLLTGLPDAIGQLEQLESFHLANNHIRELPASFFRLKNLTFLDLSSNRLRQLSDRIGELKELRSLLLYENRLRQIPESISALKHLKTLWLGCNRLRTVPRSLTQLKQLDWKRNYLSSILDGNPLVHPPIAVCRLGFAAIDKYFQQQGHVSHLDLDGLQENYDAQSSMDDDTTGRYTRRRSPHLFN